MTFKISHKEALDMVLEPSSSELAKLHIFFFFLYFIILTLWSKGPPNLGPAKPKDDVINFLEHPSPSDEQIVLRSHW